MKLLECYIENFGIISKQKFTFKDGFNCFLADNGTGKTTLSVFIKAMLFGMGEGRRVGLLENERRRYLPWSGGVAGGTLSFSVGSKSYRIERTFGKKRSEDTFILYDLKTGLVSSDLPECVGEAVFGIDEAGFERTVFISERSLPIEKDNDKVSAKLSDLAGVDADLGTFETAMERLDERRKFLYKKGGKGRISELRAEISEFKSVIAQGKESEARAAALSRERDEKRVLLDELDKQYRALLDEEKRALASAGSERERERAAELRAQLNAYKEKDKRISELFGGRVPTEGEVSEIERLDMRLETLLGSDAPLPEETEYASLAESRGSGRGGKSPLVIFSLLSLAVAVISVILGALVSPVLYGAAGIFAVLGAVLIFASAGVRAGKKRLALERLLELRERADSERRAREGEIKNLRRKRADMLLAFGLSQDTRVSDIRASLGEYAENRTRIAECERFIGSLGATVPERVATRPHGEIRGELEALEAKRRSLSSDIALGEHAISVAEANAEDAERSAAGYAELCEEFEMAEEELGTIQATMEYLERARASLTAKYIGKTKSAFEKYTAYISGSSEGLNIDTGFSVTVSEGGATRPAEAYSKGTRELYSIAARLALSDSLYEGELPFIILDDPFLAFDDRRAEAALELLGKIAKTRQVIYFTCSRSRGA